MNYIINKVRSIISKIKKDIADSREREKKRKEICSFELRKVRYAKYCYS